MIGIRLADGSVYPVFDRDRSGAKRLILTTSHDDQDEVDVEVLYADDEAPERAPAPVGRIRIGGLTAHPRGAPELELTVRLTPSQSVSLSLLDRETGNSATRSLGLDEPTPAGVSGPQDYEVPPSLTEDFEPALIESESPQRSSAGLRIAAAVIALLLLAGAGLLIWWFLLRPIPAGTPEAADTPPAPRAAEQPAAEPAETDATVPPDAEAPAADAAPSPPPGSVEYRIRRGDTLWDLSQAFYDTPWRFPDLAEWNDIPNPDLIYTDRRLSIPDDFPADAPE